MKKQNKSPKSLFGPTYNSPYPYIALPVGMIGKITKLGVTMNDACILIELVGLSYNSGPTRVSASTTTLANRCGTNRQTAARSIRKAIKLGLIVIVENYDMMTKRARKYDITPLIEQLQSVKKPKTKEIIVPIELPEPIETKSKGFGPAVYINIPIVYEDGDMPDSATEGHKRCKKCHEFGPVPCDCVEVSMVYGQPVMWRNEDY